MPPQSIWDLTLFFFFFERVDLTLLCGFSFFLAGILCSVVLIN